MNVWLWILLIAFGPSLLMAILALFLGIFTEPPKKKYWGPGESWWPDEEEW